LRNSAFWALTPVCRQIDRLPARPPLQPEAIEGVVEILRTAGMPGIAGVLVELRRAGDAEHVVPAASVADYFAERLEIPVEIFRGGPAADRAPL
jgi:hypothetical protein